MTTARQKLETLPAGRSEVAIGRVESCHGAAMRAGALFDLALGEQRQARRVLELGPGAQPAAFSPDETMAVWVSAGTGADFGLGSEGWLLDLRSGARTSLGPARLAGFTDSAKIVVVAPGGNDRFIVDPATGQEQWETDMGAAIIFTPTLSEEGILYLATLAREVLAVRNTGEILWRQSVENLVWSQPVVKNGSMYFADTSGKVYSVKTADGSIQWTQSIGGEAGTAALGVPAVLDDALIYGLENGELVAISYSGDRLWTRSVNGTLYSGPVLAGDRLLVGVTQGDRLVVSFDLNGNESWSFTPAK